MIVTDGLWRKSLSAVRALGKADFEVSVLGDTWLTTAFWSFYTARRVRAPLASRDPETFGRALLEELRRAGPSTVILPMEDPSLHWAVHHRSQIEALGGRLLAPTPEALLVAQDKGRTIEVAEKLGLPCPKTWRPDSAEGFAELVSTLPPSEFVVKPRIGSGSAGVVYGETRSPAAWRAHWERHGALLVQERVPRSGTAIGVSLLFDAEGRCVLSFAHRRLQQYPNSGGPSTDRESVLAPELVGMSIRLLTELRWQGVAMVEWKYDPKDHGPRLMEINPRFWGSLELAVRSGLDFPALAARAALGETLPDPPPYPAGVRCRWMVPGEILRYLTQHASEREAYLQFMRGLPGVAEEWDASDLPGTLSSVLCTALLALNPRFWKYVRRG